MEKTRASERPWYIRNRASERKRLNDRYKERKLWIRDYKKKLKCTDCGFSFGEYPEVCEFDHLEPEKKDLRRATTMRMFVTRYGIESALKEIAKCVPRCANCHRIKTVKSGDYYKRKNIK